MSELIRNSGMYQRLTSSTKELDRLFKEVDEKKSPPDVKKVLLLMGLGTLSWISTYSGLLELINANSGDIAFTYKLAIGFAVAMLMLMIVYILDQLFAPLNWILRTVFIFGYIFLTLISIGFGFGFYWKFLESRSEATRSAESAVTQVQGALQGGQTRLEQLEQTLTSLTALSLQKAKEERLHGNSCPNSRPGDGPRRRLRDQDAKNFSFAGDFVTKRAQSVANDIKILNVDMVKIATRHPSTVDPITGTRNIFMKSLNQRLDLTITRFNAFRTDPQLSSIRNNLAQRANTTIFPKDSGGTFKCPDNQLQSALRGVVLAIDQLPLVQKPKISAVEGPEATIEAFRRLAATLSGLVVFKMPPSEDELRELRQKAVRSLDSKKSPLILTNTRAGLNERDYIPLAIAVFVDFCLLLVSINRPMDRLKSLVPVMKDARDGPISGILSSFHATHFVGMREEFSLFQHVVFDWGGHYYVAVPLASNDVQAQYLANLFVSLEGRGIVDRAMIPPNFIIRSKLKQMGSSFAEHRAFRLYKFRNGAWSNIVMDAVMGAAKDVSITMNENLARDQVTANQLGTIEDPNLQQERNPNFNSLFAEQQSLKEQAENQAIDGTTNVTRNGTMGHNQNPAYQQTDDDQSVIELPRLFRKAAAEKAAQENTEKNNIISPAYFTQTPNYHPGPGGAVPAQQPQAGFAPTNNNNFNNGAYLNGQHPSVTGDNRTPAQRGFIPTNQHPQNTTPWQTPLPANQQQTPPQAGADILTWPQTEQPYKNAEQSNLHEKSPGETSLDEPQIVTETKVTSDETALSKAHTEQQQFIAENETVADETTFRKETEQTALEPQKATDQLPFAPEKQDTPENPNLEETPPTKDPAYTASLETENLKPAKHLEAESPEPVSQETANQEPTSMSDKLANAIEEIQTSEESQLQNLETDMPPVPSRPHDKIT